MNLRARIGAAPGVVLLFMLAIAQAKVGDSSAISGDPSVSSLQQDSLIAQRRHAWQLISAWVGSDPRPAFASWYTEAEVFAEGAEERSRMPFPGLPIGGGSAPANRPQHRGDAPVITFVHYNRAAFDHIRRHELHRAATLERLRVAGSLDAAIPGQRSVPSFPREAAVLMTGWWPVASSGDTAMPVWDPESSTVRRTGGNSYASWSRVVAVRPLPQSGTTGHAQTEFVGRTHQDVQVIPLARFHHVRADAALAARLGEDPGAAKCAIIALGRPLRAGDWLVLVALHAVALENEDGVWVTTWWHDQPAVGRFASERPASLAGAWSGYLMDVALDATHPLDADGSPRSVFNPWFEGPFPEGGQGNGLRSNCVNCHRRASYPRTEFLPVRRGEPDLENDPAFKPGRLRTARLWALAPQPAAGNDQSPSAAEDPR